MHDAIAATVASPLTTHVRSPYAPANAGQITKDGHTAYVAYDIDGDVKVAYKEVDKVLAGVNKAQQANPGFAIRETGSASAGKALDAMFTKQLKQAGELSLPLTLLILLVVFGAIVAAGIPLLLAISAVLATLGLLALPSHLIPMDKSVAEVVLLVGLAVGVDYSLFYLKREREERAAGRSHEASLEVAAATSGRAVLISGFTVIIAMAGMFLSGDKTFMSFAVGTMIVVAVAMLGSLTVLPAILSVLGDKVEKGRIPFLGRLRRGDQPRAWTAVLKPVLAHPAWAAAVSAGVLVALTIPALSLHTSITGLDSLPTSVSEVKVLERLPAPVPRWRAARDRRREGEERGRAGRPERDRAAAREGQLLVQDGQRAGARGQPRPHRRRDRRRARRQAAPTPPRPPRSARSATRSSRRRSALFPAPTGPSPARPLRPPTSTA